MRSFSGLVIALLALAVAPRAAEAAGDAARPRIAVLRLTVDGEGAKALEAGLSDSLAGGLLAAGYEVIPEEWVHELLASTPELTGCFTSVCLAEVSAKVEAHRFIRARVERAGAEYTVEVELFGSPDGDLIARREDACSVCTIGEANELVSRVAASLGVTSLLREAPVAAITPPGARRPWKWVGAGGAAVALGLGTGLMLLDGRGTDCANGDQVPCRRLYDTLPAGLVTASVGLVLAGVTAYVFIAETRGHRASAVVVPMANGVAAAVGLRF